MRNTCTCFCFWFLLLTFVALSSCRDDSTTRISSMTITESIPNDGNTVTKKDQYIYENDQLIGRATDQLYEYGQISQTTALSYSDQQVVITQTSGDVATYTLGANGYAIQCSYQMEYQTRTYNFAYLNGYLTQIDEYIDGAPGMSNTLTYHNGDLTSIRFGESNETICSPCSTINSSELPCTLLPDLYPLSLHMDAIYAHILGKSTQHMVGSYEPVNNDPKSQDSEKTTYEYSLDAQQRIAGIQQSTIYMGLIYDERGNAHLTKNTVHKKFTIAY